MARVGIFLIALFLHLSSVELSQAEDQPYKIGAILALSGQISSMGNAAKNGIEMALAKLSPEQRAQIQVVYEDDAFIPKNTVSSFSKLVNVDGVQAIIAWGSATSNSIAHLADDKDILMISISSDPRVSSKRKSVFSLWVTPDAETEALLPEIEKRGYKRIVRLTAIHDGALAVKESFDRITDGKYTLVFDQDVNGDSADFRSILARLKNEKFDAFLPIIFPEQLASFARQARELGFTQPFFGYELFEDANAVKLSNGALIGSWYSTYDDPAKWFVTEYKTKYPGASLLSAANGYDTIILLADALSQGKRSTKEVAEYLRSGKEFEGAMGRYRAAGNNKFTLAAALKRVEKDGFPKLYE